MPDQIGTIMVCALFGIFLLLCGMGIAADVRRHRRLNRRDQAAGPEEAVGDDDISPFCRQ